MRFIPLKNNQVATANVLLLLLQHFCILYFLIQTL